MRRLFLGLFWIVCCLPLCADSPQGLQRVVAYTSPLDRSQQEYGIYLPVSPPPSPAGYPAILHAHGYGWWVGTGFSDWQRKWADDHGVILVNANVRGPVFGDGVGDIATQEVISDIITRFGVDSSRICYTGGSMGGTTALRHGVRHPDLFAAISGVDGWTDYREWHWHWYARQDMRDAIEEFRRPLLEEASPVYSAGRAMWGVTGAVVDGRDNVVFPDNGLRLNSMLTGLAADSPARYDHRLTLTYDRGHCGSYDLARIYDYFAARMAYGQPGSFRIETNFVANGSLYWGEMRRLQHSGEKAVLDCAVAADSIVWASTTNLDSFTLHLAAIPPEAQSLAQAQAAAAGFKATSAAESTNGATVVVDGFPVYTGPATSVTFSAVRDASGALAGWRIAEPPSFPVKRGRDAAIGAVFTRPFTVVYAASSDRHRREAEEFAAGWNAFYVHGPGIVALPEDKLAPADLQDRNLVVYGSLETSALLRRAEETSPLPVQVYEASILVRDDETGDRSYDGAHFGCFFACPNPLTAGRTSLMVCQGQFATRPDGSVLRGFEYDLEKIPWAYPDYVVFNTDQKQLPHVMNVNDKPPVTCYEAAYFVEAGYFDDDFRPARLLELQRVARQSPPPAFGRFNTRNPALIHVSGCETTLDAAGGLRARITVADASGRPWPKARVTGRFTGAQPIALSAVTGDDGSCALISPPGATSFCVLNITATAATYDFRADVLPGSCFAQGPSGLALRPTDLRPSVQAADALVIEADVCNLTSAPVIAHCTLSCPSGTVAPAVQAISLAPGDTHRVSFRWQTNDPCPDAIPLLLQAQVDGLPPARASVQAAVVPRPQIRVLAVADADISVESPYTLTATLFNETSQAESATLLCTIPEARLTLPARAVTVPPADAVTVTFTPDKAASPLPRGIYHAVFSLPQCPGGGFSKEFTIK